MSRPGRDDGAPVSRQLPASGRQAGSAPGAHRGQRRRAILILDAGAARTRSSLKLMASRTLASLVTSGTAAARRRSSGFRSALSRSTPATWGLRPVRFQQEAGALLAA